MGASSVTGVGQGDCEKLTTKELAILANGPAILVAGRTELTEDFLVNPPSPTATIQLETPLTGSYSNYVVQLTGMNTSSVYIASMTNNSDGNFSQFRVIGEDEGTCMYMITKIGIRPDV